MHKNCEKCGLHKNCKNPFMVGRGNDSNPELIIVGGYPTIEEDNSGITFLNKSMKIIDECLTKNNINNVFMINAVSCCPRNGSNSTKPPSKDEVKYCKNRLLDELYKLPEETLIVSLGKEALLSLSNRTGVSNKLGNLMRIKIKDKKFPLIPNFNPSHLSINPSASGPFLNTWETVKSYLNGDIKNDFKTYVLKPDLAINFINNVLDNKDNIEHLYFDIETTGIDLDGTKVLGYSITYDNFDSVVYIPLISYEWDYEITDLDRVKLFSHSKKLLESFPLIGHNVKFDVAHSVFNGIVDFDKVNVKSDTYIMSHIIYNRSFISLSLKNLARTLFNVCEDWDEPINDILSGFKKKDRNYGLVPTEILGTYGSIDAYYTKLLYNHLLEKSSDAPVFEMEREISRALTSWEINGIKIDVDVLNKLRISVSSEIDHLLKTMKSINEVIEFEKDQGLPVNLNSNIQLQKMIFGYVPGKNNSCKKYLNFPVLLKSKKTGAPSFSKKAINEYFNMKSELSDNQIKFLDTINSHRSLTKLLTSYINVMPEKIDEFGIYRSSWNVCGTLTGRITSLLHSIPSRDEDKKDMKRVIVSRWAKKGGLILSLDYSQLEPRIMASISNDINLIDSYKRGYDIYRFIGSKVFNKGIDEITKHERDLMKALMLGILYGKSIKSTANDTGMTEDDANKLQNELFSQFSGVSSYIRKQHEYVSKHGGIKTVFGRFIPITEIKSVDKFVRESGFRYSQNYPIQSAASELALHAFFMAWDSIRNSGKSLAMGSVHDSLISDVYPGELFQCIGILNRTLLTDQLRKYGDWLRCPLVFDMQIGKSWGGSMEVNSCDFIDNKYQLDISGLDVDFKGILEELSYSYNDVSYEIVDRKTWNPPKMSIIDKSDKVNAIVRVI